MGLVLGATLLGAVMGAMIARKGGGRPADIAQYAAGFAIAFALVGTIVVIIIGRIVMG